MTPSSLQPFARDRLTWLAYLMLAYIGFTQSMLGPLMPFLRAELRLSYTLGGYFPAALAIGLILSGFFGDRLARRLGRQMVFWGGATGLGASAVLLGLSYQFEVALFAVLGIGFGSSLTQVMIQALLADRHGERRAVAITESNVAASLSATLTPLVVGSLQGSGLGWRLVPLFVILFLSLLAAAFHRQPVPDSEAASESPAADGQRLPVLFWLYWIVIFLVVATEMLVAVWGTDFLASAVGLSRANAALAFGAFPAAMLIGRIAGSRLARSWSSLMLLSVALLVTLIGFPLFWLGRVPALNITGLFITGLGIANLFPLTLSIAVGLAGHQTNRASARVSLGVGAALFSAPLFLGWLADRLGLQSAYGMVIGLVVAASAVVINNYLVTRRRIASPL